MRGGETLTSIYELGAVAHLLAGVEGCRNRMERRVPVQS